MGFWATTFYNNSFREWLIAVLIFLVSLSVMVLAKKILVRRLEKISKRTKTVAGNLLTDLLGRIKFFFLFIVAVYVGSLFLSLPSNVNMIIGRLLVLAILFQAAISGNRLISFWISRWAKKQVEKDAAVATSMAALSFVGKLALWAIVLLLVLDNLGIDVTGLVAGLGIGGIAVALAVQNVLGDLFASLSIVLDKPFMIGDFIIVGDMLGTVDHIGLKTTRLTSLSGEQLVFSNSDLMSSRIRNYKRMQERRILFSFGVIYQTSYEKLAAIPAMVKEIIEDTENTRFDRVHFKEYGDSSLNFEVVYYVTSPDYNLYMDVQQMINLAIYRRFEREGVEFAYPTRTVYVRKEDLES